jgi:hypothetical protein
VADRQGQRFYRLDDDDADYPGEKVLMGDPPSNRRFRARVTLAAIVASWWVSLRVLSRR